MPSSSQALSKPSCETFMSPGCVVVLLLTCERHTTEMHMRAHVGDTGKAKRRRKRRTLSKNFSKNAWLGFSSFFFPRRYQYVATQHCTRFSLVPTYQLAKQSPLDDTQRTGSHIVQSCIHTHHINTFVDHVQLSWRFRLRSFTMGWVVGISVSNIL